MSKHRAFVVQIAPDRGLRCLGAEAHLKQRDCFVMDPECLVNLKRMTMKVHLARKIQTLRISFNPFHQEPNGRMAIVPQQQWDRGAAVDEWMGTYISGEYQRLEAATVNQAILSSIVSGLVAMNCMIEVQLLDESNDTSMRECLERNAHDVLYTLQCAACRPTSLALQDDLGLIPNKFNVPGLSNFGSLAERLHDFEYIYGLNNLDPSWSMVEGAQAPMEILQHSKNLRSLELYCRRAFFDDADYSPLTSAFLFEAPLDTLTRLALNAGDYRCEHLSTALGRCGKNLRNFRVQNCIIRLSNNTNIPWQRLLEEIGRLKSLTVLVWQDNMAAGPTQTWGLLLSDERKQARMKMPERFGRQWTSKEAIQQVLASTLKALEESED